MEAVFLNKAPEVRRWEDGVTVDIRSPQCSERRTASGASLSRILQRLDSGVDFILLTNFRGFDDSVTPPRAVPLSENKDTFRTLPKTLRSQLGTRRVGAYWLIGHWMECTKALGDKPMSECEALGGQLQDALEYSWLLTRNDEGITQEDWLSAAQATAKQFRQDAFIIRLNGEATLRNEDGGVRARLSTVGAITQAWANLATLRERGGPFGYTEVGKVREHGRRQPIVLMPEDGSADKDSNAPAAGAEPVAGTSSYRVAGCGKSFAPDFFMVVPDSNSGKMLFAAEKIAYHLPAEASLTR